MVLSRAKACDTLVLLRNHSKGSSHRQIKDDTPYTTVPESDHCFSKSTSRGPIKQAFTTRALELHNTTQCTSRRIQQSGIDAVEYSQGFQPISTPTQNAKHNSRPLFLEQVNNRDYSQCESPIPDVGPFKSIACKAIGCSTDDMSLILHSGSSSNGSLRHSREVLWIPAGSTALGLDLDAIGSQFEGELCLIYAKELGAEDYT